MKYAVLVKYKISVTERLWVPIDSAINSSLKPFSK